MNSKNVLPFITGALLMLMVCLGLYLKFGNDVDLKDILPSMVTGVVTLAALYLGYLNNKEQRDIQVKTTIEKEWIADVRKHLSNFILAINTMSEYKNTTTPLNTLQEENLRKAKIESHKNAAFLMLLLNNEPLQNQLFEAMKTDNQTTEAIKSNEDVTTVVKEILSLTEIAHKLFKTKTHLD